MSKNITHFSLVKKNKFLGYTHRSCSFQSITLQVVLLLNSLVVIASRLLALSDKECFLITGIISIESLNRER